MKDTSYYDSEGEKYSDKRYPKEANDYVPFFFKRRLEILLSLLNKISHMRDNLSLLEIGCADGVISRKINQDISAVNKIVGIDISDQMIEVANKKNTSLKISFFRRGEENKDAYYDIIVEIGVINLTDRFAEYKYVNKHLKDGGYYIASLAASSSLRSILKPNDHKEFPHLLTYEKYEVELGQYFEIIRSQAYGLFLPIIWKWPKLARSIQPWERVLTNITPNLFHEKIYLLKKK